MREIKMRLLLYMSLLTAAVISGPLTIKINAGGTNTTLECSGKQEDLITTNDEDVFQITADNLKLGIEAIMGLEPRDVSLGNWTDIFKTRSWRAVKRTLKPIRGKVLNSHTEPVIISVQKFNNTSFKTAVAKAGISSDVRNTVSSTWSNSRSLAGDTQISYGLAFFTMSEHLSFTTTWGVSTYKEISTTVSTSTDISVELNPGEEVAAILSAKRGVLDIQVDYLVGLKGDVACKFNPSYRGRLLWRQDVNTVLSAIGMPCQILSRQTVRVGFYAEATVSLVNVTSQQVLEKTPAVFLGRGKNTS